MADHSGYNQPIIDEFRATGGTVTHFGRSLVLLHHVGAKSGQERVTPVAALKSGPDSWLVSASKAGAPEHPAWFHNLVANPEVAIETPDDGVVPVHATVQRGPDHDAAWAEFTAIYPSFLDYQVKTSRVIPMVRLTRH
ncbi:nitroreductase family deazaflavin-dependent oxidoreductase [Planctomonas sp. JC2975]|uniref:nitroreductase/quinone reductase family protein n=1 Tax=Planctomonas sp. JC2975 TaxID=2729626 RepID=UPI00147453AB|nr:nitroreductase/quinone reductase family protein [Planctomonas sp. JC2975]NNC11498.1 nitroreductase family deazaflavin-dependent oxidoreductase [Planctomonas sp. JC2975]